jgi:hypothetical protein
VHIAQRAAFIPVYIYITETVLSSHCAADCCLQRCWRQLCVIVLTSLFAESACMMQAVCFTKDILDQELINSTDVYFKLAGNGKIELKEGGYAFCVGILKNSNEGTAEKGVLASQEMIDGVQHQICSMWYERAFRAPNTNVSRLKQQLGMMGA